MNPRTTGILFLVAAALFAWIYFYEVRGGEARDEAEKAAKRIFPALDADSIRSLSFRTSDDRDVRVVREEEDWHLAEPLEFPADGSALDTLANTLTDLESVTAVEEPQGLEVYGLGSEAKTVVFEAGDEEHRLRIGNKTPVGSDTYVADDEGRVYTVASFRVQGFDKSLDDLRNKKILDFDRDAVERIEVRWPDGEVALARSDESWSLVTPIEAPADEDEVRGLLSDLSFLRATGFVDEPGSDAELGLDAPELSVTLQLAPSDEEGAEPEVRSLTIGKPLDEESRAARGSRPEVYRIASARLDDFPREVMAYRFKQLADFVSTDAERVEIVFHDASGGQTVAVTADKGEGGWTSTPEAIAAGKTSRLVAELARLEAERILADAVGTNELPGLGLAPPAVVLRVLGAEPEEGGERTKLAEVHIGVADAERGIVAQAPDGETPDLVFSLPYDLAEHLPVSLEAFRNRFLAEEEPAAEGEAPAAEGEAPPAEALPGSAPFDEAPAEEGETEG